MRDWFTPSEETVQFWPVRPEIPAERTAQFRAVPPESPAEQTIDLVLFSIPRDRPLHHWMDERTPTEPLWPVVDQDLQ